MGLCAKCQAPWNTDLPFKSLFRVIRITRFKRAKTAQSDGIYESEGLYPNKREPIL